MSSRRIEAGRASGRADPVQRRRQGAFDGLISEVRWTPGYVGLLVYVFTIVTYRVPLAMPGMVVALAGVLLSGTRIRVPPLLIAFGAFILWGLIGYTQSSYSWVVWERLILLGKLWIIAFVIVNAVRTPAQLRFFLVFFLVCFATHPARGAIFNYLYGYTVDGRALWNHIFANPNDLAALTLFPLAVAVGLLRDSDLWIRRGAQVSVVVLTALVFMTQSRGGFLALAVMAIVGVFRIPTGRHRLRTIAGVLLIGVTAAVIAPSGVWDRVSSLSEGTDADSSSRQRWEIWEVAREIAADHKVFGVGMGAYPRAHNSYTRDNPRYPLSRGTRDTHSTYLNVLAEGGWPGLLIFLSMIGITLNDARRARRRATQPLDRSLIDATSVGLLAYLAAAVFGTFPQLAFLYLHLAVLSVLCRHALVRRGPTTPSWQRRAALVHRSPAGTPRS